MSSEDRKRRPQSGGSDAADREERRRRADLGSSAPERLEHERRRAVRAEGRLAEIELALRRALDRADGQGISAPVLRELLESLHARVASLEDEVRISERELLDLVDAQRKSLGAMSIDREELARGLEEARREMRETLREQGGALSDPSRQRIELEVELDRLQSLLHQRDSVCDGLSEELVEGARIAEEVAARLTDLARGRVAAPRRRHAEDSRVAAMRRNLEKEQAEVRQARRALEAARAELKVAQRSMIEIEEKAAGRLAPLERRLREVEAERDRLQAEIEATEARGAADRARLEQTLDRERSARVQANETVLVLERRLADLERQLSISGEEREDALRSRLAESESNWERIESERIRLAERVSLLEAANAALSAKEAQRARVDPVAAEGTGKSKVVPLVSERDAAADSEQSGAALPARRQTELDKLSGRWSRLQAAYQEAVAEFDEVRARRARRPGAAKGLEGSSADRPLRGFPPAFESASAVDGPADAPGGTAAVPGAATGREEARVPGRKVLVHFDDRPELIAALRQAAAEQGLAYRRGPAGDADLATASEVLVAANLLAPASALQVFSDLPPRLVARALLYAATADRGRIFANADVFPAPFDPVLCASHLVGRDPWLRRVMAVGEFPDAMGRLRELLGRSLCSTAVAFNRRQALDLVTLVRPQYVLVDLCLADGSGLDLLADLFRTTDPPLDVGVTWSRPIAVEDLRPLITTRLAARPLEPTALVAAAAAISFDRDTPAK